MYSTLLSQVVQSADKASAIQRFQAGGKRVAMVGDAANDAPALATPNVGIAIDAGTDVAVESSGIVDREACLGRRLHLVAIPAAAGLFLRWGVDLPMGVGAIAMGLSRSLSPQTHNFRGLRFARTESASLNA